MARSKKGRAGNAARHKAVANGNGGGGSSTARRTNQDIASNFLPKYAPTQSQPDPKRIFLLRPLAELFYRLFPRR